MPNKKSKSVIMLLIVMMLAVVAAACGGSGGTKTEPEGSAEPTKKTEKQPVTIKIATWVGKDNEPFQAIPKAFTKKFPWINVEWIFVDKGPGAVHDAVTQSIAAGDPIDVFWHNSFVDTVIKDFAEDLTPYIGKDPDFKSYKFLPGYLETFQWKGKQYALSRGNDVFLVYYNKDLLKKYGLEPPKNDWTWEDLKLMAKKATNPAENHYGISNHALWFQFGSTVLPYVNGHAENFNMLNGDMTKSVADQPDVLADLQWMLDWVTKDGIMLNPKRAKEKGLPEAQATMWMNGQSLFTLHVSPNIPGFKNSLKFGWDVAPMPRGTAKQAGMSFINPMFVSKASKHKEEAWEFMKFWAATTEGQKLLIDAGGTFPNTDNPEIVNYFKAHKQFEGLNNDALVYASKIAKIDPTIIMLGGSVSGKMITDWTNGKGYGEEASPYDYFPPAAEKLNKDLDSLKNQYK
ncbi:ABC transporter substrate-binding protein [Paenibacillus sp. MBLB4367]|uniref:ABC transporter substrate-binding protein n=1 Tax=Paenibacillus sp. MBLB4367 TaxID=3384767 RepID=UPI003907F6C5